MKHKKTITSIAFLLLVLGGLHAQESLSATGGEATGTGGTASYSVGQVVFSTNTGTNGSVAQGVQQPYEISTTTGINERSINLELSVYPNPTSNYLILKVDTPALLSNRELRYRLYDLQGKVIESKTVKNTSAYISLEGQATATYFLKVANKNQTIKTFKIIKK